MLFKKLEPLLEISKKEKCNTRQYAAGIYIDNDKAVFTDGYAIVTLKIQDQNEKYFIYSNGEKIEGFKYPNYKGVLEDFLKNRIKIDCEDLKKSILAISTTLPKNSLPFTLGIIKEKLVMGQFTENNFNPWLVKKFLLPILKVKSENEITAYVSKNENNSFLSLIYGDFEIYILGLNGV